MSKTFTVPGKLRGVLPYSREFEARMYYPEVTQTVQGRLRLGDALHLMTVDDAVDWQRKWLDRWVALSFFEDEYSYTLTRVSELRVPLSVLRFALQETNELDAFTDGSLGRQLCWQRNLERVLPQWWANPEEWAIEDEVAIEGADPLAGHARPRTSDSEARKAGVRVAWPLGQMEIFG